MIDGIQLTFQTRNPNTKLLGLPCWEVLINEKSKQRVNDIRTAHIRGLDLQLKPSTNEGFSFLINGSLHKFFNCGEHNTDQFNAAKLFQSLDSLTDIFGIGAENYYIHGLEIGVNIPLPYSPLRVLKNIVCYRSRPFTQINKRSAAKGLQCSLTQYRVKVYDKAKQSGVDCGNVLRFEVAIDKMQALEKYNISTLADLYDLSKVYSLIGVLCEALDGIVWTDTAADLSRLTDREQKQWLALSNAKTWENLERKQRYKAKRKWENLLCKYGHSINLSPLLLQTWESLFLCYNEAENGPHSYQHLQNIEADKKATFLPFIWTVKTSLNLSENSDYANTTFSAKESAPPTTQTHNEQPQAKRLCQSCKRDITAQSNRSVFCSEKIYGNAAKRCRNQSSNRRRDHKRKINAAMKKDNYLLITYTDEAGVSYSDILHPSEMSISKEWLNRIQSITNLFFQVRNIKKSFTCESNHKGNTLKPLV